jgi:hypothetical protein
VAERVVFSRKGGVSVKKKRPPQKSRKKTPILTKVKRLLPVGYWVLSFLKFLLAVFSYL